MFLVSAAAAPMSARRAPALTVALAAHAGAIGLAVIVSLLAVESMKAPQGTPPPVFVQLAGLPGPDLPPKAEGPPHGPVVPPPPEAPEPTQPAGVVTDPAPVPPVGETSSGSGGGTSTEGNPGGGGPGNGPDGPPGPGPGYGIPGPGEDSPIRVDHRAPGVTPPEILHQEKPDYPRRALAIRRQGTVVLEAVIGTAGQLESVTVLRSDPYFDEAALAAVSRWRFKPALVGGRPVRVYFTLTVNFQLK